MSSFLGGAMTQKDYLLFQDNIRKEKANLDSRSLKISIARLIIGLLIVGFLLGGNFSIFIINLDCYFYYFNSYS